MKTRKTTPRTKVTPTVATKSFESFKEAIVSMRNHCKIIDDFFRDIDINDEDATADAYTEYVSSVAAQEFPQLLAKHNIHTSYHISASRVSVRGEQDIQFGWELTYVVTDGHAAITGVNCTIIMYNVFTSLKQDLTNDGWELVEKKK